MNAALPLPLPPDVAAGNFVARRKKCQLLGQERQIPLQRLVAILLGVLSAFSLFNIVTRSARGMAMSSSRAPKIYDDGCGRIPIDNHRSPTWTNLKQSDIEEAIDLRACLNRSGWEHYATQIGKIGLSCRTPVSFNTIRTTLSRYDTVWLHGDSIMAQAFYTLACAINFTATVPSKARIENQKTWVGLGERSALIEKFTYSHKHGSTEIKYSRFGPKWPTIGNGNLYKHDFPFAVRTLSSKDVILTTGAAAHYSANAGSQFKQAVDFIAKQSLLANASVFLFEPTPEEWPTSNGFYTPSCSGRCYCETLTNERLQGRGNFSQRNDNRFVHDKRYAETLGKPEKDFFRRLYPSINETWLDVNTDRCIPNCLPNCWRTDLMRQRLKEVSHDVNLVPVYYQMLGNYGEAGRGHGDCLHRNLYGTQLMLFQWVRAILWGSHAT